MNKEDLMEKVKLEGISLSDLAYPGHFKKSSIGEIPSLKEEIYEFFALKIKEGLKNLDLPTHLFGVSWNRMEDSINKISCLKKAWDYIRKTDPEMRFLSRCEGDNVLYIAVSLFQRNIFVSLREWVPAIEECLGFAEHRSDIPTKIEVEGECSFEETHRYVGPSGAFSSKFESRDEKQAFNSLAQGWKYGDDFEVLNHYSVCDRDVAEYSVHLKNGKVFYFKNDRKEYRSVEYLMEISIMKSRD